MRPGHPGLRCGTGGSGAIDSVLCTSLRITYFAPPRTSLIYGNHLESTIQRQIPIPCVLWMVLIEDLQQQSIYQLVYPVKYIIIHHVVVT